jgi:hypothetical protein
MQTLRYFSKRYPSKRVSPCFSLLTIVTTFFLYSRLNALITCHQISEDVHFSWLDTPYQLPLPRDNPSLPPTSPNLGLIIIPSHFNPDSTTDEGTFTTYRLLPDLSLVGDMYGSQTSEIEDFVSGSGFSHMNLETSEEDSETEEWRPWESNWVVDVTRVARQLVAIPTSTQSVSRPEIDEMKGKIVENVMSRRTPFETLYEIL